MGSERSMKAVAIRFAVARASRGGTIESMKSESVTREISVGSGSIEALCTRARVSSLWQESASLELK